MTREKAPECPDAHSTRDWEICLNQESSGTEANYQKYVTAIRATLNLKDPAFAGLQPMPGELTTDQLVAEFDKTANLWESCRDAECAAAFHQFGGGTGGPPAEGECRQRMMRDRMRDLDRVYNVMLYH